jgi:hypothetical protein
MFTSLFCARYKKRKKKKKVSNRKNYNSIVFLTTLSVYLGLVLVGGAAPVLAHSALTRDFDIKNEIEFKDNLDKKPDDEKENLSDSVERYFDKLESFIKDLRKLHSIGKFNLDYDKFQVERNHFSPCSENGLPLGFYEADAATKIENLWIVGATTDAVYRFEDWNDFSDCLSSDRFGKNRAKVFSTKISYDKAELKVELSTDKVSSQNAELLTKDFNQAFRLYELGKDEVIIKELYKDTSFSFKNNQVFIVTCLPRAAIDELLAQKVAQ